MQVSRTDIINLAVFVGIKINGQQSVKGAVIQVCVHRDTPFDKSISKQCQLLIRGFGIGL